MVKTREEMTLEHQLQRGVARFVFVCACVLCLVGCWQLHFPVGNPHNRHGPIKREWVTPHEEEDQQDNKWSRNWGPVTLFCICVEHTRTHTRHTSKVCF
jgi:hypothetical protein